MDPNVALLALLRTQSGTFIQQGTVKDIQLSGFPKDFETLKKFNVLLLGDVDRSIFSASQLRDMQRFVEEGGGFLMTGEHTSLGPGGYDGTPVAELLPVQLGGKDIGQEKDPFDMKLTADGASHPIFSGIEPFFATPEGPAKRILPPLFGCTRVGPSRPGATTLAVHPRRTGPTGPASSWQIPYLPESTGKYEVDFSPPAPGEYEVHVAAEAFGKPLDEVKVLSFRVGRPNLEFDKLDLDDEMLKRLAEETKGRYVTLVGLSSFIEQLKSTERARSTITSVDVLSDRSITVLGQSVSLYLVAAFTVFSALLTAEWVLRRRRQLL